MPPDNAPASIACEPCRFFARPTASTPTSPSTVGIAPCTILSLRAQTATSYSSRPHVGVPSISASARPKNVCNTCCTTTSRKTSHLLTWFRFRTSAGVCSRYCGKRSYVSTRWKSRDVTQYARMGRARVRYSSGKPWMSGGRGRMV